MTKSSKIVGSKPDLKLTEDQLIARAAKQAAEKKASEAKTAKLAEAERAKGNLMAVEEPKTVRCRVTDLGAGQISTGVHVAGFGEVHYEEGEEVTLTEEQYQAYRKGPVEGVNRAWVEKV